MTIEPVATRVSEIAKMACLFNYPRLVFAAATTLRIILLFYGIYQDNHSPLKYTDIDYFVFTDAAKYVSQNRSPYDRDTYRYTPLLSWLLLPTTWGFPGRLNPWFSFGKALFAVADVVAGYLLARILQVHRGLEPRVALQYASIWLLNPMVAVISTRGSAEGLLGVLVTALLWAVLERQLVLAGALLGICVHFKIYPFIYGPAILWFLNVGDQFKTSSRPLLYQLRPNSACITVTAVSLAVFSALNAVMAAIYGYPFIQHTFLHHFTRLDHRHNFSLYNVLLYLSATSPGAAHHFETVAFVPQLLLAAVLIPLVLARRELAGCMLVQTFAFVTFNKVCTSQVCLHTA